MTPVPTRFREGNGHSLRWKSGWERAMSETGSAPSSGEGSGSSGSGGDQTSDPGKTGAVQEVAKNEAMFAQLPIDVIGLICDQLDQKSRLAVLSVNKAFANIGVIRQKVEADAQDHVMESFKTVGGWEATRNALPNFLTTRYRTEYRRTQGTGRQPIIRILPMIILAGLAASQRMSSTLLPPCISRHRQRAGWTPITKPSLKE